MTLNLSKDQLAALMASLNPGRISTRRQGSANLSYLEAWDVKATLIRAFGFGGFSADVIDTQILDTEREVPNSRGGTTAFRVTAMSTVRLTIHGRDQVEDDGRIIVGRDATYTETAVASQAGADPGEVADFAVKTAESDALKRCATYLGTQFGLSLYDKGSTQDVVRIVLEPGQRALVEELRAESEQRHAASVAELSKRVDRATSREESPPEEPTSE